MNNNEEFFHSLETQIIACHRCPRLVEWRQEVARVKRRAYLDWEYWGKPVPGFGDYQARVLVVGLAPGAHGANRTGRMFTGDGSGDFLYPALHRAGFASQSHAVKRGDGLKLEHMFISAVCRIDLLDQLEVIVALGRIAFDQTLRIYRRRTGARLRFDFAHGATYSLGDGMPWLVASYHPSRQNTQTGRLTETMFADIWEKITQIITLKN
jgi:uracil-DNA glycosylase